MCNNPIKCDDSSFEEGTAIRNDRKIDFLPNLAIIRKFFNGSPSVHQNCSVEKYYLFSIFEELKYLIIY